MGGVGLAGFLLQQNQSNYVAHAAAQPRPRRARDEAEQRRDSQFRSTRIKLGCHMSRPGIQLGFGLCWFSGLRAFDRRVSVVGVRYRSQQKY